MFRVKHIVWLAVITVSPIVFGTIEPASAHAFGQRYDLPVPLGLYLFGAAATVALSFVVIAAFIRRTFSAHTYPRVNLLHYKLGRLFAHPAVGFVLKLVSVILFIMVVLTGLLGTQQPTLNLAPTFVWIICWVGLAYISALVGNVWVLINPWRTLFAWAEMIYRWVRPGHELSLRLPYPAVLGVWPAAVLFLLFAWIELVFYGSAVPVNIAWGVLGYSLITWAAMFLFGREHWLKHGEAFSLAFGVLARFALTEVRVSRTELCSTCELNCLDPDRQCINCYECFSRAQPADREWALRPFAVGLARDEQVSASMVAFVLLMLSTILFDGFMATPAWSGLVAALHPLPSDFGGIRLTVIATLGLIGFWCLFLCIYGLICWAMRAVSGSRSSTMQVAQRFTFTLVPIAIAYHLAHYLTYLLVQGQLIIPLLSDPFGWGWNLLGTARYRIDIAVVGARFAWYTAVVSIVVGHVVAVYLAHVKAARAFANRRTALYSQLPMTGLMLVYTVCGLWVLAQPIVEIAVPSVTAARQTSPALVTVPAGTLVPEPGSGQLHEVGGGTEAKRRLTYRVMTSVFHDETRMNIADILYAYMFAYRWGVSGTDDIHYDPYVDAATALMRKQLVGVKFRGTERPSMQVGDVTLGRELLIIEVYIDAGTDPNQAAAVAPPWSTLPWHLIVLMEEAVIRGWAAFSQAQAARHAVPWLDLVRTGSMNQRLASLVAQFEKEGYRPESLKAYVSIAEARARWYQLNLFYQERRHFLVTNGPYLLKTASHKAVTLEVFRHPVYPLGVGSFDAYAIPRRAHIAGIELGDGELAISAEVEVIDKGQRTYDIVRKPLRGVNVAADEIPICRYVVVAADGTVRLTGRGRLEKNGTFKVDLRNKLSPGVYTIMTTLYLNGNTMNPDIKRVAYTVADN